MKPLESANNILAQVRSWTWRLFISCLYLNQRATNGGFYFLVITFPSFDHKLELFIPAPHLQISKPLESCCLSFFTFNSVSYHDHSFLSTHWNSKFNCKTCQSYIITSTSGFLPRSNSSTFLSVWLGNTKWQRFSQVVAGPVYFQYVYWHAFGLSCLGLNTSISYFAWRNFNCTNR